MTGGGGGGRGTVLLPPINFIHNLLQQRSTVSIWLFDQFTIGIEGKIRGFDEFMNLVIDDAIEVKQATKTTKEKRRSNSAQGRQCITHPSTPMTKVYPLTLRIIVLRQIRTAYP